jgi:hypothetical protein
MDDEYVRQLLIDMVREDQVMREKALKKEELWDDVMDKKHTIKLKQIIAKYGWPTIPRVGVEASNDAWLLAQHADHDRAFQKDCLALLKSLSKGDVSLHNIAYLEDRILISEGKPQLYGTQFQGQAKGLRPQPIQDKTNVDKRRKAMGLNTLADYKKTMLEYYSKF